MAKHPTLSVKEVNAILKENGIIAKVNKNTITDYHIGGSFAVFLKKQGLAVLIKNDEVKTFKMTEANFELLEDENMIKRLKSGILKNITAFKNGGKAQLAKAKDRVKPKPKASPKVETAVKTKKAEPKVEEVPAKIRNAILRAEAVSRAAKVVEAKANKPTRRRRGKYSSIKR